jgi:hypothetical protein
MKYISYAIVGIILSLNILLLFRNARIKERFQNEESVLMNERDLLEVKVLKQTMLNDGFRLSGGTTVEDASGKILLLKSLIKTDNRLVLRFSSADCVSCVNAQIDSLKKLSLQVGPENILLLANFDSPNDLKILKQKYALDMPLYNLSKAQVPSAFENVSGPYYFLLHKDLSTGMVFSPLPALPKCTGDYLTEIKLLFKGNNYISVNNGSQSNGVFDSTELNLGRVKKGKKAEAIFTVKNVGKSPLLINKVTPSCSCTVTGWQKLPIQPGNAATVSLDYDSGKVGYFNKTAFVFMNSVNSPVRLVISGEIVE